MQPAASLDVAILTALVALVVAVLSAGVTLWTARKSRSSTLDQKLLESELRINEARQTRLESLAGSVQRLRLGTQTLAGSLREAMISGPTAPNAKELATFSESLRSFEEQWDLARADFVISFGIQAEQMMRFVRHELRNEANRLLDCLSQLTRLIKQGQWKDRGIRPEKMAALQESCNAMVAEVNEALESTLRALDIYYYTLAAYLTVDARARGRKALVDLDEARPSPFPTEPIQRPFPLKPDG